MFLSEWREFPSATCLCRVSYPACNALTPHYHLLPTPPFHIFPHYLTNGKIFEKRKLLHVKCVILCINLFGNISHSKNNGARYDRKCMLVLVRERVGYVRTQLSCILFIVLTTTCFGNCGPSSGHKNVYRGKLYTVWSQYKCILWTVIEMSLSVGVYILSWKYLF